jgi:nucleotide-binding universal stress UspA family protein
VIPRRGRQLLHDAEFAVAVAQRGLHEHAFELRSIGVGYDGGAEAAAALSLAAEIGAGASVPLDVLSVIGDEIPMMSAADWIAATEMPDLSAERREAALANARSAAGQLDVAASVEAVVGDPGLRMRALSETVDLVVVGSRRWGAWSRLVAGSVGETLVHDAGCSVLLVPRPPQRSGRGTRRHRAHEAVA